MTKLNRAGPYKGFYGFGFVFNIKFSLYKYIYIYQVFYVFLRLRASGFRLRPGLYQKARTRAAS